MQQYLVLAQDEPRGWLWTRHDGGWNGPTMIEGGESVVSLPAISVELPFSAIYRSGVSQ